MIKWGIKWELFGVPFLMVKNNVHEYSYDCFRISEI